MDSDEFRSQRRTCYSKLCAFFELMSKARSLGQFSPEHSETFIGYLMSLLTTADAHLQKLLLTCILKATKKTLHFNNPTVRLPKYAKLLEALLDDVKFKDVIPIIFFGAEAEEEPEHQQDTEMTTTESKRTTRGNIPPLEADDRLEVLPFIIKLLFSKLLKKKG